MGPDEELVFSLEERLQTYMNSYRVSQKMAFFPEELQIHTQGGGSKELDYIRNKRKQEWLRKVPQKWGLGDVLRYKRQPR